MKEGVYAIRYFPKVLNLYLKIQKRYHVSQKSTLFLNYCFEKSFYWIYTKAISSERTKSNLSFAWCVMYQNHSYSLKIYQKKYVISWQKKSVFTYLRDIKKQKQFKIKNTSSWSNLPLDQKLQETVFVLIFTPCKV